MFDIHNTVFLHQQAILKELLAENLAYLSLVLCVLKNCDDFPISHDPYSPPPPAFSGLSQSYCAASLKLQTNSESEQWTLHIDMVVWFLESQVGFPQNTPCFIPLCDSNRGS